MYLRYIFFHPNWDSPSIIGYDKHVLNTFQFNCYFVCHYLSLAIRKQRYPTDGTYNSIGVYLSFSDQEMNFDPVGWKCLHDLHCSIMVSIDEFDKYLNEKDPVNRYEFYLSCLERGYAYINKHKEIPIDLLLGLHEEFRKNGYKNERLFKQLCVRPFGMKVIMTKVLTTSEFNLRIQAFAIKTGALLCEGSVFRTMPDDIYYADLAQKAEIKDDKLVILGFFSKPFLKIDLQKLANGVLAVEYLDVFFNEEKQKEYDEGIKGLIW